MVGLVREYARSAQLLLSILMVGLITTLQMQAFVKGQYLVSAVVGRLLRQKKNVIPMYMIKYSLKMLDKSPEMG